MYCSRGSAVHQVFTNQSGAHTRKNGIGGQRSRKLPMLWLELEARKAATSISQSPTPAKLRLLFHGVCPPHCSTTGRSLWTSDQSCSRSFAAMWRDALRSRDLRAALVASKGCDCCGIIQMIQRDEHLVQVPLNAQSKASSIEQRR
jgi:hypothetical protein